MERERGRNRITRGDKGATPPRAYRPPHVRQPCGGRGWHPRNLLARSYMVRT